MEFGLLKNLNSIQDTSPAKPSSRPEATAEQKPAQGPSFGSVLAARSKPSAPKASASKTSSKQDEVSVESGVESTVDQAPVSAPKLALSPKQNLPVNSSNDFSSSEVGSNDDESAWSEFLGAMDEKLNVQPKDVLKAFESLSDEDLAAKPEESVDKMVAAMGLSDQNAILAKQLLTKLIQKTDKPVEAQAPEANPIADLRAADKSLTAALERMDAHMLMNKQFARPVEDKQEQNDSQDEGGKSDLADLTASTDESALDNKKDSKKNENAPKFAAPPAPAPEAPVAPKSPAPAVASTVPTAEMNSLVEQMQPVANEAAPKVDQMIQNIIDGSGKKSAFGAQASSEDVAVETETEVAAPAPKSAQKALDALIAKATKHAAEQEQNSDEDETDSDLDSTLAHPGDARLAQTNSKSDDFASKLAPDVKGAAQAAPANGPELIDNARIMLRNGGGEMKVTVNSEVGEVAMNVSVKDGKVSVSMVAESDDAKKLLEHQLGDLKAQLSAHNLQIDKLQVDTNSNLGSQSDQNQARDNQRQANQSQGWDNLNQQQQSRGQQQNQARRQMAYDAPSSRAYGTRNASAPAMMPRPAARLENSGRLNLVA